MESLDENHYPCLLLQGDAANVSRHLITIQSHHNDYFPQILIHFRWCIAYMKIETFETNLFTFGWSCCCMLRAVRVLVSILITGSMPPRYHMQRSALYILRKGSLHLERLETSLFYIPRDKSPSSIHVLQYLVFFSYVNALCPRIQDQKVFCSFELLSWEISWVLKCASTFQAPLMTACGYRRRTCGVPPFTSVPRRDALCNQQGSTWHCRYASKTHKASLRLEI